jgi:serine/threonine protein kinase
MHQVAQVAHGDLKPDNIVITENLTISLIDLGHSEHVGEIVCEEIGTSAYRAPEVSANDAFGIVQTDIYSLACTLFVIMFQRLPFGKEEFKEQFFYWYSYPVTKNWFFGLNYGDQQQVGERHP